MKHPHTVWPPLVHPASLSVWVRLRDGLITLSAWILMIWLIRYELSVVIDYFRPPIFELTHFDVPNWAKFWAKFGGFILVAVALVGWIGLWAIGRRKIVYQLPGDREPAPLPLEEQARFWGLSPEQVASARQTAVVHAKFNEDGLLTDYTS